MAELQWRQERPLEEVMDGGLLPSDYVYDRDESGVPILDTGGRVSQAYLLASAGAAVSSCAGSGFGASALGGSPPLSRSRVPRPGATRDGCKIRYST